WLNDSHASFRCQWDKWRARGISGVLEINDHPRNHTGGAKKPVRWQHQSKPAHRVPWKSKRKTSLFLLTRERTSYRLGPDTCSGQTFVGWAAVACHDVQTT